ncbi:MAG: hypothetical protein JOZ15_17440 [Acidobacteria bacterium]|nr:hypothetical protein [Acidobacteriota bacterium]
MSDRPGQPLARPRRRRPAFRGPELAWPALGKVSLVAAAALASLAASWLRWINPFVDSGREMNVPARLAAGEMLYRDVVFYYGPSGPWLQALVLRAWEAARLRLAPVAAPTAGRPRLGLSPATALLAGRPQLRPSAATALLAGHSWLPLEIACLALTAAILVLLYRLAAAAGGPGSALAATALAAAFCLGAPHGGAFIFPYSASSLYALAGGLLALTAGLRPPGWRRRLLVAGGLMLALTARAEIGGAVALLLLIAGLRSRTGPTADPGPSLGEPAAAPGAGPGAGLPDAQALAPRPSWPRRRTRSVGTAPAVLGRAAVADVALGAALAAAIYGAAFAGTSWHVLLTEGPFTHVLAMPPEWQDFYGAVSGFADLDRSLPELAWGLAIDALLLLVCAWPAGAGFPFRRPAALGLAAVAGPPGGSAAARPIPGQRRWLPRLAFAAAVGAGIAAFSWWGGPLRWRWAGMASELPPALFPLPLIAAAATLAALRRPLDARGRARFMLFGLAAALAARVLLACKIAPGPGMSAYCALPLPLLLATAAVLAGDLLAPRLRDPGGFRFRLLVVAAALAALHLARVGALAWGPHIVRLDTAAGSLRLPWKEATATADTLDYLAGRARPGDRLASFPEAGFFNFVTGLPNPLRQEEIFPGVLGDGREAEAVARLLATRPRFVLLANRPTAEFGPRAFGDDYAAGLWSAVEDRYSLAATFGNAADGAPIGARRFFIRVYEPDAAPAERPAPDREPAEPR